MKGTLCSICFFLVFVSAAANHGDRNLRGAAKSEGESSDLEATRALASSSASRSDEGRSDGSKGNSTKDSPTIVVEPLIDADETILGQRFRYPDGRAELTAVKISIPPGATTGPHKHGIPLYGYMLKGKLTVDYGSRGKITYRKGDSLVEAVDWPHEGRNLGKKNVELIAVYAGARGVPLSEPTKKLK